MLHLPISPAFKKNSFTITMQSSDFFAPYAAVTLQSILDHADSQEFYDVIVMTWDMTNERAEKLASMATGRENVSIRVVDVSREIHPYVKIAKKRADYDRFSATGVIRLLLPELLKQFDTVLNLDCDVIFYADVAVLRDYDLSMCYMAGAPDVICCVLNRDPHNTQFTDELLYEKLGLASVSDYLNAGVLLLNLELIRKDFTTDRIINFALSDGQFFTCYEQDTFNGLFRRKKGKLSVSWNYLLAEMDVKNLPSSDPVYQDYIHASKKQKGIHFVGMKKPWSDARIPHARSWWEFAKETPFFEEIFERADVGEKTERIEFFSHRPKNMLFCAETKFQLLTALNIKYHYFKHVPADLILCSTQNLSAYLPSLKSTGLFRNCFLSHYDHQHDFDRLMEEPYVRPDELTGNLELRETYTDYFLSCAQSVLQKAVYCSMKRSRHAALHIFEGSLSAYFENLHLRLAYPFKKENLIKDLTSLYLYHPEFYCGFNDEPTIAIPQVISGSGFSAILQTVFEISTDSFSSDLRERYIFLGDNFECIEGATEQIQLLDKVACIIGKENIAVKPHPLLSVQAKKLYELRGYHVLGDDMPWELRAGAIDGKRHILIAVSSGAVMTPYTVTGNKIPVVILKNLLKFSWDWYHHVPEYNAYLYKCKKEFKRKNIGFFCPTTLEEFKKIIWYLERDVCMNE